MPLDASVFLFYASLALSAAAVALFLWLMRETKGRETEEGRPETNETRDRVG